MNLCLWCYEEKHNKKLRVLRKRLRLAIDFKGRKNKSSYTEYLNDICSFCGGAEIRREGAIYVCLICNSEISVKSSQIKQKKICPYCQAESVYVDQYGNERCRNCEKNEKIAKKSNSRDKEKSRLAKIRSDNFKTPKKETERDQIINACKNHLSLIITYKGIHRIIYPYACNDIYCVAYCTYRNELRTFRIDRMKSLQNGNSFKFNNSLYHEAQEKVNNAQRFYY